MEISERKGWPYYTVRYWIEKHNIKRRTRPEACYYGYWNRHSKGESIPPYEEKRRVILEKIKYFYYKEGLSVPEIADRFEGSPWSIYKQMRKAGLGRRTVADTNRLIFERKELSYALKKELSLKEQKLKIAGIMLYWGEGDKNVASMRRNRGGTVDLANSDPKMIKLFLKFLREICGIDEKRLRVYLYCYANQDVASLKKYWSKITKISLKQFIKPYVRKDFSPEKIDRMKYGLVHVRYSDKKLFLQLRNWTEEYLKQNGIM
ncbi:MAG: hypothetical protein ACE5GN_05445 [Waddliaceae bacterium]